MFLDAQVKQRADREKSNQEITKQDFNNMANSISNKEKREQFMVTHQLIFFRRIKSVNKLGEMNQEIMKQYELRNSIKQKHHERELQIELDTAIKDK